jgi:hypothetical protein
VGILFLQIEPVENQAMRILFFTTIVILSWFCPSLARGQYCTDYWIDPSTGQKRCLTLDNSEPTQRTPENSNRSSSESSNKTPESLPSFPMSTQKRVSNNQDEWLIEWNGSSRIPFYVTYGAIVNINGTESERSVTFDGQNLPISLRFFLETGLTVTATINLLESGEVSARIYKNGKLCHEATQSGNQPAIRVTCSP